MMKRRTIEQRLVTLERVLAVLVAVTAVLGIAVWLFHA